MSSPTEEEARVRQLMQANKYREAAEAFRRGEFDAEIPVGAPGEMSELTGKGIQAIQANRERVASDFAKAHNVILALKGYHAAEDFIQRQQHFLEQDRQ